MGLDVYMFQLQNGVEKEEFLAARTAHLEAEEALYERGYDSEDEKEQARQQVKETTPDPEGEYLGFDEGKTQTDTSRALATRVQIDHPDYPDHLFKIGYWRSSYNAGGLNSVANAYQFPDLYWIMFGKGGDSDQYVIFPDWEAALPRAEKAIEEYDKAVTALNLDKYSVMPVEMWKLNAESPANERQVMEIFSKELERHGLDANKLPEIFRAHAYSAQHGEFFMGEPIRVVAMMPGVDTTLQKPEPCVYVVYEGGLHESYRHSLEIVRDTIKYAVEADEPCYIHWSA